MIRQFIFFFCFLFSSFSFGQAHRYVVSVNPSLTVLRVNACFAGFSPKELVTASESAADYILDMKLVTPHGTKSLRPKKDKVFLGKNTNACVNYAFDLNKTSTKHSFKNPLYRVGNDLITSPELWLWRPQAAKATISIKLDLPPGISASTPWMQHPTAKNSYRLGHAPYDWPSRVAFGHFKISPLNIAGVTLHVAIVGETKELDHAMLMNWVKASAGAVALVHGKFPVSTAQVLVVATGPRREAVPWAEVTRGGGNAIHFFIDQTRSAASFADEWTAPHEFSHMLHPYIERDDAWLSEGIASYYQNVARARAGMLSPEEAWQKLHEGFQRGAKNPNDMTLSQVTDRMAENKAYMRVYWSGAAIMLLADVRLRELSQGKESLDTALEKLSRCCLPSERAWSAKELTIRLDRLTKTKVFQELYSHYANSTEFPKLDEVYEKLGLVVEGEKVKLSREAPLVKIRTEIMNQH